MTTHLARLAERGRRGEAAATGLFATSALVVALLLAFLPHTARPAPTLYTPERSRLDTNWAFQRVHVHPVGGAATYGLWLAGGHRAGGRTFTARAFVRPAGRPGGRICLSLEATAATVAASTEAHECHTLVAGWHPAGPVRLRTRAASRIVARLEVSGTPGGFEARPLKISR